MIRTFMIAAASATVLSLSPTAFAQSTAQYGNADEAKAMLRKAIIAVKADKTKAFDMFIKGEGGFLDRDLYPLCFSISDGKILAVSNPYAKQFLGKDIRTLKDVTGKVYGPEIHGAAQKAEGEITEVSYMFQRPDNPTPVQKVSFVTAAGDVGCSVGYYK